jgi:hypothetical protein
MSFVHGSSLKLKVEELTAEVYPWLQYIPAMYRPSSALYRTLELLYEPQRHCRPLLVIN